MAQLLGSNAHAGLRFSDKLNASSYERPADLFDRLELGVDSPRHSRNQADGCDADAGCNGRLKLLPSHKTRGALDWLAQMNVRSLRACYRFRTKEQLQERRSRGLKGSGRHGRFPKITRSRKVTPWPCPRGSPPEDRR